MQPAFRLSTSPLLQENIVLSSGVNPSCDMSLDFQPCFHESRRNVIDSPFMGMRVPAQKLFVNV